MSNYAVFRTKSTEFLKVGESPTKHLLRYVVAEQQRLNIGKSKQKKTVTRNDKKNVKMRENNLCGSCYNEKCLCWHPQSVLCN